MARINGRETPDAIARREPFQGHGSIRGKWVTGMLGYMENGAPASGQLPKEHRAQLRADLNTHGRVYVVWSYATPIAWTTPDGETRVPDVKYSVTTSRHQGYARRGFA